MQWLTLPPVPLQRMMVVELAELVGLGGRNSGNSWCVDLCLLLFRCNSEQYYWSACSLPQGKVTFVPFAEPLTETLPFAEVPLLLPRHANLGVAQG